MSLEKSSAGNPYQTLSLASYGTAISFQMPLKLRSPGLCYFSVFELNREKLASCMALASILDVNTCVILLWSGLIPSFRNLLC